MMTPVWGSLTIRLIALVSQKTRKQARTRWMRHHPSRCEEPLREAGVRAAIPGAAVSVVRRPQQRRDGLHRTGSKRGAKEPKGSRAAGLMRPVFFLNLSR